MKWGDGIYHGAKGTIEGRVLAVEPADSAEPTDAVEVDVDDGPTGWLVVADGSPGRTVAWSVGDRYRVESVTGCCRTLVTATDHQRVRATLTLMGSATSVDPMPAGESRCPDCGGALDVPDPLGIEAPVVDRIGRRDGPLIGICGDDVDVDERSGSLDWRPQRGRSPGGGSSTPPSDVSLEIVCRACGTTVIENLPPGLLDLPVGSGWTDPDSSSMLGQFHDLTGDAAAVSHCKIASEESLGLTTGGGGNVENFRANVEAGYLPQPDALTETGLFGEYAFETAGSPPTEDALFTPTYDAATTADPITGEVERYLTVGLDASLEPDDFERPRLDLVVALDVSNSMSSQFDRYHYDDPLEGTSDDEPAEGTSDGESAGGATEDAIAADGLPAEAAKIDAARSVLRAMTRQLGPDDRFGLVLYADDAHVAMPLSRVGNTPMDALRERFSEIQVGGGTNMAAGHEAARELLEPYADDAGAGETGSPAESGEDAEHRVVFLTDAMPNQGRTGRASIVEAFEDGASAGIHSTFVGVGVDANPDLIESISRVRGANHFFVDDPASFERRLADEFAYMVTPLVYDCSVDLVGDDCEVAGVYGSPTADASTDEVLRVGTLFPSPRRDGETQGGVVLVKLRATGSDPNPALVASWEERDGAAGSHCRRVTLSDAEPEQFDGEGVRKAVALHRYARELRAWLETTHETSSEDPPADWRPQDESATAARTDGRSEWEQASAPLWVDDGYRTTFERLHAYLAHERTALGDERLERELEVLERLREAPASPPDPADAAGDAR